MKKAFKAGLIVLSVLTPIASQASTGHRDAHHNASITFTEDNTSNIIKFTRDGILITGSLMSADGLIDLTASEAENYVNAVGYHTILSEDEIHTILETTEMGEKWTEALHEASSESALITAAVQKIMNNPSIIKTVNKNGVSIGVTTHKLKSKIELQDELNRLHAENGKTIHYRYDGKKSDKEVRTEIKRWLQKKSYLKDFKIKTDKFDHGTHTYTYKAADTWITVKL